MKQLCFNVVSYVCKNNREGGINNQKYFPLLKSLG